MGYKSQNEPNLGDRLWTEPQRVTKSGQLIGSNPIDLRGETLKIQKKGLRGVMPGDLVKDISTKNSFRIRNAEEIYAEITEIGRSNLFVEVVPKNKWPDETEDQESDLEYYKTEREEPIEWEGTEQKIDSESTKNRTDTFKQGDTRGTKNDLLGGHL